MYAEYFYKSEEKFSKFLRNYVLFSQNKAWQKVFNVTKVDMWFRTLAFEKQQYIIAIYKLMQQTDP